MEVSIVFSVDRLAIHAYAAMLRPLLEAPSSRGQPAIDQRKGPLFSKSIHIIIILMCNMYIVQHLSGGVVQAISPS